MKFLRIVAFSFMCLLSSCVICNAETSTLHDTYNGDDFVNVFNSEMIKTKLPYRLKIMVRKRLYTKKEIYIISCGLEHSNISTSLFIGEFDKKIKFIRIYTKSSGNTKESLKTLITTTAMTEMALGVSSQEMNDMADALIDASEHGTGYFYSFAAERRFIIKFESDKELLFYTIIAETNN